MSEVTKTIPSHYGIIGNKFSAALVSKEGSIDWCCMPLMYSPSIFSAFINPSLGGYFSIKPAGEYTCSQHYIRETNVLETAFRSTDGTVILTDFMPIYQENDEIVNPEIIRMIRCCDGEMDIQVDFYPRFNYGKGWNILTEIPGGILTRNFDETAILAADMLFSISEGHARTKLTVRPGAEHALVFCYGIFSPSKRIDSANEKLGRTIRYWRSWSLTLIQAMKEINGLFKEPIMRSGLAIKLLANPSTGLVSEAPALACVKNHDNIHCCDGRICWMGAISSSLISFTRMGNHYEAELLMKTTEDLCARCKDNVTMQTACLPDGNAKIKEIDITVEKEQVLHIRNSTCLERGYGWYGFGMLIEALFEYLRIRKRAPYPSLWEHIVSTVNLVIERWATEDGDFWKMTSEKKHFVISKILAWVALDRGIRLSEMHHLQAPVEQWRSVRAAIHRDIIEKGFNREKGSFVRFYGSDIIDATCLLIPRMGFLEPDNEHMHKTLEAVYQQLVCKDYLVRRVSDSDDGVAYTLCSIWLADCLLRKGDTEKAGDIVHKISAVSEPFGFLPEKILTEGETSAGFFPHMPAQSSLLLLLLDLMQVPVKKSDGKKEN